MTAPDQLRAIAREAADAERERWLNDRWDTRQKRHAIADAVLAALTAPIRAQALEEAAGECERWGMRFWRDGGQHESGAALYAVAVSVRALTRNEHREREGGERG